MSRAADARCVADVGAVLGEGPVWDPRDQALYWLDIKGLKIFRRDQAGAIQHWTTPFRICSLAPRAGGGFIAGTERGFAEVDPVAGKYEPFDHPESDRPGNRFNDGKLDREGRFWAGTMDDAEQAATGALYRLDADRSSRRFDDGYRVTNGPAFSGSGQRMYHNDSGLRLTYVFDVDDRGLPSNRLVFARYTQEQGHPDGMTVDAEDCLWIAFWGGWCVRRFSPAGECIATIELPVQQPTSCAFGGPSLDQFYVTSASIGLTPAERDRQPFAGGLFMLDTHCAGVPDIPFQG